MFEYDKLRVGCYYGGTQFTEPIHKALERFHSTSKTRYYSLIHNGVEFCEYVGVIQVDGIQIEVLPKLDRNGGDESTWRDLLIGMLREVGMFRVSAPSSSLLSLKSNSILKLYFDIFITEVEYLVRTGLVKQYRKQTLNHTALKGSLDFPGHLSRNIVHKERFYTKTSVYDHDHIWHTILRQTIDLIRDLSQNADLHNRIGALNLNFPEVTPVRITEQSFNNLIYTRKTESYRVAIEIARLLLLRYHPGLTAGNDHVLALMFDMNLLWESFIYHSLRKQFLKNSVPCNVKAQTTAPFWKTANYRKTLRPDILIEDRSNGSKFILDTKWKDVAGKGPSPADLQQLFVYSQFFRASRNALVYPGATLNIEHGVYNITTEWSSDISCSMISLGIQKQICNWQKNIYETIMAWMGDTASIK